MKYYIWTIGCQMNKAESLDISDFLESMDMQRVSKATEADIAVLNTCVVRQNAEDKVTGMLGYLKGIWAERPEMKIAVTGCFVTDDLSALKRTYPHVSLFFQPGETGRFQEWVLQEYVQQKRRVRKTVSPVSVYIPIIQGCNNFCSYCIVPYRRGRERSRRPEEILEQAEKLVMGGAREIILVGQNVNTYGNDLERGCSLASLLFSLSGIKGIERIRFLTNHPKDMSEDLIEAIAALPNVCHHACLPLQAGDDAILKAMNRNYTMADYWRLVHRIRSRIGDMALSTDIIVGFPGETDEQFRNTYRAIEEIQFTAVHVAAYSTRTGTAASREYKDNVEHGVKLQRLHSIEELQRNILNVSNNKMIGADVKILVEGQKNGKWFGRTYSDKPVFFTADGDYMGKMVDVEVKTATAWALQGGLTRVHCFNC